VACGPALTPLRSKPPHKRIPGADGVRYSDAGMMVRTRTIWPGPFINTQYVQHLLWFIQAKTKNLIVGEMKMVSQKQNKFAENTAV
jgi:hypothetical protein